MIFGYSFMAALWGAFAFEFGRTFGLEGKERPKSWVENAVVFVALWAILAFVVLGLIGTKLTWILNG